MMFLAIIITKPLGFDKCQKFIWVKYSINGLYRYTMCISLYWLQHFVHIYTCMYHKQKNEHFKKQNINILRPKEQ